MRRMRRLTRRQRESHASWTCAVSRNSTGRGGVSSQALSKASARRRPAT